MTTNGAFYFPINNCISDSGQNLAESTDHGFVFQVFSRVFVFLVLQKSKQNQEWLKLQIPFYPKHQHSIKLPCHLISFVTYLEDKVLYTCWCYCYQTDLLSHCLQAFLLAPLANKYFNMSLSLIRNRNVQINGSVNSSHLGMLEGKRDQFFKVPIFYI